VVLGAVISAVLLTRANHVKNLESGDTIILADFTNTTGDPVFDDTLNTALDISLRDSRLVNVLSAQQVARQLKLMGRGSDTRLSQELAGQLCQRVASPAYIAGTIGTSSGGFLLTLKAVRCQTGEALAKVRQTTVSRESVINVLGMMTLKVLTKLGESLDMVKKLDVPLEEATTSSLDALKAYSLGQAIFRSEDPAVSLRYHELAVQLDPNFAMAHWALGWDYIDLGEIELARRSFDAAMQKSARVSEPERLEIAATYYFFVTGDLSGAEKLYESEIKAYPLRSEPYRMLGDAYAMQGKYREALEVTQRGLQFASDSGQYESLGIFLLALQRLGEARSAFERTAQKADDGVLHEGLYAVAFIAGDAAEMARQEQWFANSSKYETDGLSLLSDTEAYAGHLHHARLLARRAVSSAIRADRTENGALWRANAALREAAFGNTAEARRLAMAAIKLSPGSEAVKAEAALALARGGDAKGSQFLATDLSKDFPRHTHIQKLWLPTIEAQQAIAKGYPILAIQRLESATSIESALIPSINNLSCLYTPYIRGEAYLSSGQGTAAAAEFKKITDHSGLVWNCWTGALAHLGLARAYVLQSRSSPGTQAKAAHDQAVAAYQDFLNLWNNADSDIPILVQAKAEYARLQ
jgi:tetratricopeptide (TPR) repeat protein